MARQRVTVYYNIGTGTLPSAPNCQSSDADYHGHLAVGDVNGDGYPDVAVSVYIGPAGFGQKGRVKVNLNNNGILSSTPSWIARDSMYTFSCVWGDADGDGDSLPRAPVQRLLRVAWNGNPDSAAPYCFDLENGWISFKLPANLGTVIDIRIAVSHDLDLAVSNWDPTVGNYVFRNTPSVGVTERQPIPGMIHLEQNYPNPISSSGDNSFTHILFFGCTDEVRNFEGLRRARA